MFGIRLNFDVNKWLADRAHSKMDKLLALCTHCSLEWKSEEDAFYVESFFHTTFGTTAWQCRRCGTVVTDGRYPGEAQLYWAKHPQEWLKREKKFVKQARKVGIV